MVQATPEGCQNKKGADVNFIRKLGGFARLLTNMQPPE